MLSLKLDAWQSERRLLIHGAGWRSSESHPSHIQYPLVVLVYRGIANVDYLRDMTEYTSEYSVVLAILRVIAPHSCLSTPLAFPFIQ